MGISNRMEASKESLKLFVRSLPTGCSFTIFSFGTRFSQFRCLQNGEETSIVQYNEECMPTVLEHIQNMKANHGGTDILGPLKIVKSWGEGPINKRVFILTDGFVNNPFEVIEEAGIDCDRVRVFTFGLGSDCDVNMVRQTAVAGRGTCSLVKDSSSDLNSQVIRALQSAMEPSLKACKVTWNQDQPRELNEVFRDQNVFSTVIMPMEQF